MSVTSATVHADAIGGYTVNSDPDTCGGFVSVALMDTPNNLSGGVTFILERNAEHVRTTKATFERIVAELDAIVAEIEHEQEEA